jgi:hypothetical protein
MIISFSKDQFVERIASGQKIHTVRSDQHNRWKPGMKMHMWRGNPRNTSANPYHFANAVVKTVARINISLTDLDGVFNYITIDGKLLNDVQMEAFAKSDGFDDLKQMAEFFPEPFWGKLIIWEQLEIIKK